MTSTLPAIACIAVGLATFLYEGREFMRTWREGFGSSKRSGDRARLQRLLWTRGALTVTAGALVLIVSMIVLRDALTS